jgi:hypothetical protein
LDETLNARVGPSIHSTLKSCCIFWFLPRYNKANPDDGDYGLDPLLNLLAHPHAFAAISDVHVHPRKGCSTAGDLKSLNPMIASLYHYLPEKVITPEAIFDDIWRKNPHFGPCVRALREELYGNGGFTKQGDPVRNPTGKSVVVDFFDPGKWRPKPALLSYLALGTANNVANLPKHKPAYGRIRERVIGVRGVSLWHAFLEHPAVDARAAPRDRLLLCCCMNVDGFHVGRLEHTRLLDRLRPRVPKFGRDPPNRRSSAARTAAWPDALSRVSQTNLAPSKATLRGWDTFSSWDTRRPATPFFIGAFCNASHSSSS